MLALNHAWPAVVALAALRSRFRAYLHDAMGALHGILSEAQSKLTRHGGDHTFSEPRRNLSWSC